MYNDIAYTIDDKYHSEKAQQQNTNQKTFGIPTEHYIIFAKIRPYVFACVSL